MRDWLRDYKFCEYNIVVICLLPKQKTRVRFPLLAQPRVICRGFKGYFTEFVPKMKEIMVLFKEE